MAYFCHERSPTEYQGCFNGRPRTSRTFAAAAGVTMKHDGQEIASIIAPGRPSMAAEMPCDIYTTSYRRQFQKEDVPWSSLRAATGQSPYSATFKMTHSRCIAHEQQDAWKHALATEYTSMPAEHAEHERLRRSTVQARRRPRVELEDRWRRWQDGQRQEKQATACSNAGASQAASVMPAGLRQAKCLHDVFVGGIRVPLFSEDLPEPQWTTLANAPWVGKPKQVQRTKAHLPPWLEEESMSARERNQRAPPIEARPPTST